MYLEAKKRVRLNSQLPDHPIGKHDRVGYAPITEYSIDVEGYHSLADLYKDVPGLDHFWYKNIVEMLDAPEPEPIHTTMTDVDKVIDITTPSSRSPRSERLLRPALANARTVTAKTPTSAARSSRRESASAPLRPMRSSSPKSTRLLASASSGSQIAPSSTHQSYTCRGSTY
jgi:hypothetical protein